LHNAPEYLPDWGYSNIAMMNDLKHRFTYHPPLPGQPARYAAIRDKALELATLIATEVPPGREFSLALTNLEQAVFWANAGIARGEE
jgi:hypothetical protein